MRCIRYVAGSATFKESERVAVYAEEVLMKQSVSDNGWSPYYQPEMRNPKVYIPASQLDDDQTLKEASWKVAPR